MVFIPQAHQIIHLDTKLTMNLVVPYLALKKIETIMTQTENITLIYPTDNARL